MMEDFMGMMSTEDGGQDDAFNSWFNVNTAPQDTSGELIPTSQIIADLDNIPSWQDSQHPAPLTLDQHPAPLTPDQHMMPLTPDQHMMPLTPDQHMMPLTPDQHMMPLTPESLSYSPQNIPDTPHYEQGVVAMGSDGSDCSEYDNFSPNNKYQTNISQQQISPRFQFSSNQAQFSPGQINQFQFSPNTMGQQQSVRCNKRQRIPNSDHTGQYAVRTPVQMVRVRRPAQPQNMTKPCRDTVRQLVYEKAVKNQQNNQQSVVQRSNNQQQNNIQSNNIQSNNVQSNNVQSNNVQSNNVQSVKQNNVHNNVMVPGNGRALVSGMVRQNTFPVSAQPVPRPQVCTNRVQDTVAKARPVQATKPIPKQQTKRESRPCNIDVERKYRYSIKDKISELRELLVPGDTKLQKSGVLKKAIETVLELRQDKQKLLGKITQLEQKQELIEKNNTILITKLGEGGASIVYLEPTQDVQGTMVAYSEDLQYSYPPTTTPHDTVQYEEYYEVYNSPDNASYLSPLPTNTAYTPDSPDSMDHTSDEEPHHHKLQQKKRRIMPDNKRQRTIPIMCMVFCFGVLVPNLIPSSNTAQHAGGIGRSLLEYNPSEYMQSWSPTLIISLSLALVLLSILSSLLLLLFSTVRVSKPEELDNIMDEVQSDIKNGKYLDAQRTFEGNLTTIGVCVHPGRRQFLKFSLQYLISLSPLHKITKWLVEPQNERVSKVLLLMAEMQLLSKHFKKYNRWTGLCYTFQALELTDEPRDVYLTMSLLSFNPFFKKYFYAQCVKVGEKWLQDAEPLIFDQDLVLTPGVPIYQTVALELTRKYLSDAAGLIALSDLLLFVRQTEATALINKAVNLLPVFSEVYPSESKELEWLVVVLETALVWTGCEREVEVLLPNNSSVITEAISTAYQLYSSWHSHEEEEQEWVGEEIGPTINNFCKIVSVSSAFQKDMLFVAMDWLVQVQMGLWEHGAEASTLYITDSLLHFKQSLTLMEQLVGSKGAYKLSLYGCVRRVMKGANPAKTRELLEPFLKSTEKLSNDQAGAVALCLKHLPENPPPPPTVSEVALKKE